MKQLNVFQQLLDKLVAGDINLIFIPCKELLFAKSLLNKLNNYGILWEANVQVSWYRHLDDTCYFICVKPGMTSAKQNIYIATMTLAQCELEMSSIRSSRYAMLDVTAIIS